MNFSDGPTTRTLTADRGDAGCRLDLVVRRHCADLAAATRTRIQAWIEAGRVTVNGVAIRRVAARAAFGDIVSVRLPRETMRQPLVAETLRLEVLYEDADLLAVNKPAGMVVHPTYKNTGGTLLNALLWHARGWPPNQRPSLVGRLDKLTSGVVLVAKTPVLHATLQRAMLSTAAEKTYLAVVYGRVNVTRGAIGLRLRRDPGDRRKVIASDLTGAISRTTFERLARVAAPRAGLALLRCRLVTGRTHQIRVHLAARGWPLVGDPTYGEPRWTQIVDPALGAVLQLFPRQALHAWRLALIHPLTGQRLTIDAPIPEDLSQLLAVTALGAPSVIETTEVAE